MGTRRRLWHASAGGGNRRESGRVEYGREEQRVWPKGWARPVSLGISESWEGHIVSTVKQWGRSSRLLSAAVATALAALVVASPVDVTSGGNVRPGGGWSGLWLSAESTASGGTSLRDVRTIVGADVGAAASLTGAGVGVALIDTGVAGVPGLPAAQIVNGPDLSFESQSASLRYLDTYGHGTHMAGIIVGNDTATGTKGIAPKAKLTSLKLGTPNGAVDVTQVIPGMAGGWAHPTN